MRVEQLTQAQQLIQKEMQHWSSVLNRIIAIIQFLAERNLAFRGSVDRLFEPHNGNFLGLVELLAKFDPYVSEHLRRIKNDEIHDHYLGKRIHTADGRFCFEEDYLRY